MKRPDNYFLEIACFNIESALIAQEGGADRIEFCAGRDVGGTTPDLEDYRTLRHKINPSIPINVMIRPRGGDFNYSNDEFETMKDDIDRFKPVLGPNDGFVCGILTTENRVDFPRCQELLRRSSIARGGTPGHFTYHRAFDEIGSLTEMVNDERRLYDSGFKSILTSGGKGNATDKVPLLFELQKQAERLDIIVGGGVRASNLQILKRETFARWYHSSAITGSGDNTNLEEVRAMKRILSNIVED
jgi:copper homeostasis protein